MNQSLKFEWRDCRECLICGKEFVTTDRFAWICHDCETEYVDFESIRSACKEVNNEPMDFKLNNMYASFFKTKEEMEDALDYYIRQKMSEDKITEGCIDFCRSDPFWFESWVVPKVKEKRGM